MIRLLYNLVLTGFLIAYLPYTFVRTAFRREFGPLLLQRMGWSPHRRGPRPIWVHAASVGEVRCTLPLIKRLRIEAPEIPFVITTMTRTGNQTARSLFPDAEGIYFFPFDHPWILRKTIRRLHPRLLLIAETELWPNLLRSCEKARIPVLLFNGRISQKSFRGYLALKSLFQKPLRSMTLLLMQTEGDRNRIIEMGALRERTRVTGNLKFDQTLPPSAQEDGTAMAESIGLDKKDLLLIGGSTHPGEEEILIGLFRELRAEVSDLRLLLAPRHLDRLEEVEKLLKQAGLSWIRKTAFAQRKESSTREASASPPVILLDTMGELMRLYSLGTLVFIGGSLVPVGGHNPLEPLLYKKCVLFGPYMFNFSEIAHRLAEEGGALQVSGKEDLFSALKRLIHDPGAREKTGEMGNRFLQTHRGATERMIKEIRPYLTPGPSPATDPS